MKKTILVAIILVMVGVVMASSSLDYLTKPYADTLYCQQNGVCSLTFLNVTNITVTNINATNVLNEHWVNESGDTMTGSLNMSGNSIGFDTGEYIYPFSNYLVLRGDSGIDFRQGATQIALASSSQFTNYQDMRIRLDNDWLGLGTGASLTAPDVKIYYDGTDTQFKNDIGSGKFTFDGGQGYFKNGLRVDGGQLDLNQDLNMNSNKYSIFIMDNQAGAFTIEAAGETPHILLNTTNGAEQITLGYNLLTQGDIYLSDTERNQYIRVYDGGASDAQRFGWRDDWGIFWTSHDMYVTGYLQTSGTQWSVGSMRSDNDIYTSGANDDLWLGTTTQGNALFRAYADGNMYASETVQARWLNGSWNGSGAYLKNGTQEDFTLHIGNITKRFNVDGNTTIYGNVGIGNGLATDTPLYVYNRHNKTISKNLQYNYLSVYGNIPTEPDGAGNTALRNFHQNQQTYDYIGSDTVKNYALYNELNIGSAIGDITATSENNWGAYNKVSRSTAAISGQITINDYGIENTVSSVMTANNGFLRTLNHNAYGTKTTVSNTPSYTGSWDFNVNSYGEYILVTGNTVGTSNAYGLYIQGVSSADNNYAIYDDSGKNWILDADNQKILFGEGQDATIFYDGTDLFIAPAEVGTGDVIVSDSQDGGEVYLKIENSLSSIGGSTDETASLRFGARDTMAIPQRMGRITAEKVGGYGISGAGDQDSAMSFYTTLNGVDTKALRIDENQMANFTGDIQLDNYQGSYVNGVASLCVYNNGTVFVNETCA